MRRPITDIIFDLDGTLVDSAPGILASFGAVLESRGIPPQAPLTPALIGPPLAETLARLTGWEDPALLLPLIDAFKADYDRLGIPATPAYPEVDELLRGLAGAGMRLHIATNKRIAPTRLILEHLDWGPLFHSVYALDMREPRIPSKAEMIREQIEREGLSPGTTCYVGDRLEDGLAADDQPIPFVLAAWGYGEGSIVPAHWWRVTEPLALPNLMSRGKARDNRGMR